MNFINYLNENRKNAIDVINNFYKYVSSNIRNLSDSREDFNKFKTIEHLKYISYEEYVELIKLKKEIELVANSERCSTHQAEDKCTNLLNKLLMRFVANEMCAEDCKGITDANYTFLEYLGYRCESDKFIPEIVRRNFVLIAKREYLKSQIESCCEVVDRLNLALKNVLGIVVDEERGVVKIPPEIDDSPKKRRAYLSRDSLDKLKSNGFNAEYAEMYFRDMEPARVRKNIGSYRCALPSRTDMDTLLYDYDGEIYRRIISLRGKSQKTKDEIVDELLNEETNDNISLDDFIDQSAKKYDELALAVFDRKKEKSAIVKSGYDIYRHIRVYEKVRNSKANHVMRTFEEVKKRLPKTRSYFEERRQTPARMYRGILEAKEREESNPFSGLFAEINYRFERSTYKKDKTDKNRQSMNRARKERDYYRNRGMLPDNNEPKYPKNVRGFSNTGIER